MSLFAKKEGKNVKVLKSIVTHCSIIGIKKEDKGKCEKNP